MATENKRSTFVTALAWIGIVFAGFGTFITALQNIMFQFLMPQLPIEQLMNENNSSVQVPEMAQFMFKYFDLIFLAAFLVSLFALIASIGLLKRKNWARIVFIALLALGIIWNLVSLVFQKAMTHDFPLPPDVPEEFQSQMETMMTVMSIASIIFVLIFTALFGWIIWKLRSPQIVKEFSNDEHLNV